MKTAYQVIQPSGEIEHCEGDWPKDPGYAFLATTLEPLLGEHEPLEHVRVWDDGRYKDMFVSEYGQLRMESRGRLPRNAVATEHYRRNTMTHEPDTNPADLPDIRGVAILFDRQVWF